MIPEALKERKKFYVDYEFPELPGGKMRQSWSGEATNIGMAVHLAFKEIRQRSGVKARRLHKAKVTIVEIRADEESS